MEKNETLCAIGGNRCTLYGSLKILKIELPYMINNFTSGNISTGNENTMLKRYLHSRK